MNCWDKQQAAGWAKTNKEDTIWQRAGSGLSLTWGRGQNGHIREVLQGIAAQVCIKCTCVQYHNSHREKIRKSGVIFINSFFVLNYFIAPYFVPDYLFFCRLKKTMTPWSVERATLDVLLQFLELFLILLLTRPKQQIQYSRQSGMQLYRFLLVREQGVSKRQWQRQR